MWRLLGKRESSELVLCFYLVRVNQFGPYRANALMDYTMSVEIWRRPSNEYL